MTDTLQFDLVIPLYNEEQNLTELVEDIAQSGLVESGLCRAVLVDNGSTDGTKLLLADLADKFSWIKPISLPCNIQYGGGIAQGLMQTEAEFVAIIPGDNQVSAEDVRKVWHHLISVVADKGIRQVFIKGHRTVREDTVSLRLTSGIYTRLANAILGLGVNDVNGLPKIFHRSLLVLLPTELLRTFTFDAQLLDTARRHGWHLAEVPVRFLARRAGVSSWSRKRLHTYRETITQLWMIRQQRHSSFKSQVEDKAPLSQRGHPAP